MSEAFKERLEQFRADPLPLDVASMLGSVYGKSHQKTQQQSLAQSLKARRELKEKIEIERQSLGLSKYGEKFRLLPKETDAFGTAIRMRPETPKINLLEI